jgi:hypothetical protein
LKVLCIPLEFGSVIRVAVPYSSYFNPTFKTILVTALTNVMLRRADSLLGLTSTMYVSFGPLNWQSVFSTVQLAGAESVTPRAEQVIDFVGSVDAHATKDSVASKEAKRVVFIGVGAEVLGFLKPNV